MNAALSYGQSPLGRARLQVGLMREASRLALALLDPGGVVPGTEACRSSMHLRMALAHIVSVLDMTAGMMRQHAAHFNNVPFPADHVYFPNFRDFAFAPAQANSAFWALVREVFTAAGHDGLTPFRMVVHAQVPEQVASLFQLWNAMKHNDSCQLFASMSSTYNRVVVRFNGAFQQALVAPLIIRFYNAAVRCFREVARHVLQGEAPLPGAFHADFDLTLIQLQYGAHQLAVGHAHQIVSALP